MRRAFHLHQLMVSRNRRQGGSHFIDGSERGAGPVQEQRRSFKLREVRGAQLLWLARRMQRVGQEQQRVGNSRVFRGGHGRLPSAIRVTAEENAGAGNRGNFTRSYFTQSFGRPT